MFTNISYITHRLTVFRLHLRLPQNRRYTIFKHWGFVAVRESRFPGMIIGLYGHLFIILITYCPCVWLKHCRKYFVYVKEIILPTIQNLAVEWHILFIVYFLTFWHVTTNSLSLCINLFKIITVVVKPIFCSTIYIDI